MTTITTTTPKVIKLHELVYRVESLTTKGKFYSVIFKDGAPSSCNCPRFEYGKAIVCKHMYILMAALENETVFDATDIEQKLTTKPVPKGEGLNVDYGF